MLLDYNLVLSDAQAETTQAAHDSTSTSDCGVADANMGGGTPIYVVISVNTAFTSGGAATLAVKLQESDDDQSFTDLIASKTSTLTQAAVAGAKLMQIALPPVHKRYIKAVYTIGVAAMTDGAIDAYLTTGPSVPLA